MVSATASRSPHSSDSASAHSRCPAARGRSPRAASASPMPSCAAAVPRRWPLRRVTSSARFEPGQRGRVVAVLQQHRAEFAERVPDADPVVDPLVDRQRPLQPVHRAAPVALLAGQPAQRRQRVALALLLPGLLVGGQGSGEQLGRAGIVAEHGGRAAQLQVRVRLADPVAHGPVSGQRKPLVFGRLGEFAEAVQRPAQLPVRVRLAEPVPGRRVEVQRGALQGGRGGEFTVDDPVAAQVPGGVRLPGPVPRRPGGLDCGLVQDCGFRQRADQLEVSGQSADQRDDPPVPAQLPGGGDAGLDVRPLRLQPGERGGRVGQRGEQGRVREFGRFGKLRPFGESGCRRCVRSFEPPCGRSRLRPPHPRDQPVRRAFGQPVVLHQQAELLVAFRLAARRGQALRVEPDQVVHPEPAGCGLGQHALIGQRGQQIGRVGRVEPGQARCSVRVDVRARRVAEQREKPLLGLGERLI